MVRLRAEGPQKSDLTNALRQDDAERVVDNEGRHEERYTCEPEQQILENRDHAVELGSLLVFQRSLIHDLEIRIENCGKSSFNVGHRRIRLERNHDLIELVRIGAMQLSRGVDLVGREQRSVRRVRFTETDETTERKLVLTGCAEDAIGLANFESMAVGRIEIHDEFARPRRAAFDERHGAQFGIIDPRKSELRRADRFDDVTIGLNRLHVVTADLAGSCPHAGKALHLGKEVVVNDAVGAEVLDRANDKVGAGDDLARQRTERVAKTVGKNE